VYCDDAVQKLAFTLHLLRSVILITVREFTTFVDLQCIDVCVAEIAPTYFNLKLAMLLSLVAEAHEVCKRLSHWWCCVTTIQIHKCTMLHLYVVFLAHIACAKCIRCGSRLLLPMSLSSMVCLCVLITTVNSAKRLNQSRCRLGNWTFVGQRIHYWMEVQIPQEKGTFEGHKYDFWGWIKE